MIYLFQSKFLSAGFLLEQTKKVGDEKKETGIVNSLKQEASPINVLLTVEAAGNESRQTKNDALFLEVTE